LAIAAHETAARGGGAGDVADLGGRGGTGVLPPPAPSAGLPAPGPMTGGREGLRPGGPAGGGVRSVVLGIPTVSRPKGVNYLDQTLRAALTQIDKEVRESDSVALWFFFLAGHKCANLD